MDGMGKIIYIGPEEVKGQLQESITEGHTIEVLPADREQVKDSLDDAVAIVDHLMKLDLDADLLTGAESLAVVSCASTGSDHVDTAFLEQNDIAVHTLREDPELLNELTPAAELAWALLLACGRDLRATTDHVIDGNWNRESFPGMMMKGNTLGIVGLGRLGRWVAQYGDAFDMNVLFYDPYVEDHPDYAQKVSIEELFERANYITIHVHLTDETNGLVSRSLLERTQPGTIFVNTSRGEIVDEAALLDLLESGHLGGVGLDVLTGEPNVGQHPIVEYAKSNSNVIITPHCGGYSMDAVRMTAERAVKKTFKYL